MAETLICTETLRRVGFTVIDGVNVVQYDCTLPSDAPGEMRIIVSKLNLDMYKANREICRADLAKFEDMAYTLQDEMIAAMTVTEKSKEA